MAQMIREAGHPDVQHPGTFDATAAALIERVRPGDLVVLLSQATRRRSVSGCWSSCVGQFDF